MKFPEKTETEFQLQYAQNPSMLCPRQEISRFLAHYEIFKMAITVPGSFAEVGVFKGAGLLTWTQLLSIFCPGDTSRKVYGFDNFTGFESLHDKDGQVIIEADIVQGGWNPSAFYPTLLKLIQKVETQKMLPNSKSVHLVEGDVQ
jgi:hypothetical protein